MNKELMSFRPWWSSMWQLESGGPNPFYVCRICGEDHPGVENILEGHAKTHIKTHTKESAVSAAPAYAVLNVVSYRIRQLRDSHIRAAEEVSDCNYVIAWNDALKIISEEILKLKVDSATQPANSSVQEWRDIEVAQKESDASAQCDILPEGWKQILVNESFSPLIAALERADRKGYMPDAMKEEWDAFDYRSDVTTLQAKSEPSNE